MCLPRFRLSRDISPIQLFLVGPACGVLIATIGVIILALLTPRAALSAPYCGDAVCNEWENHDSCPIDCPPNCGNGVCEDGEDTQWCFADCLCVTSYCGDGYCLCGELAASCADCCDGAVCGNGSCETPCGENWVSCEPDCADYDPPTTTATLSGTLGQNDWYISPVTVTLTATDSNSGVYITYLDGTEYVAPRIYMAEGPTTIAYQSRDNANNLEDLQSTSFWIDTVAPVSTFATPPASGGWVGGVVTLAGTSVDETSGVARVEVSFDGGTSWQTAVGGAVWAYQWDTRALPGSSYTLWVRGIDQAGNVEEPVSATVSIDRSAPFFDVGPFPPEYCFTCSGPITFTLTAFDEQSGIANSAVVVKQDGHDVRVIKAPNGELHGAPVIWDGRDEQGSLVPPGDYQLLFYTANRAGLFGSYGASFRVIDVQPAVPPTGSAPLIPVPMSTSTPWIMTPRPPTPTAIGPVGGMGTPLSGSATPAPQVAVVPEASPDDNGSIPGSTPSDKASNVPGAVGTSAAALLAAAAAYIAAQQTNSDGSLGSNLAGLAMQYVPPAKPAAPPVPEVAAPRDAPPPPPPPPPPPRPPRLYWWQKLGWPSYTGPAAANPDNDTVAAYNAADYPTGWYKKQDGTLYYHVSHDDCVWLSYIFDVAGVVTAIVAGLAVGIVAFFAGGPLAGVIAGALVALVTYLMFNFVSTSINALDSAGAPGFNIVLVNPSTGSWGIEW